MKTEKKLISFVVRAEQGFFKKPDINEVYLTYNMLHKPALLGILGAIIGLHGFGHEDDEVDLQKESSKNPKNKGNQKKPQKNLPALPVYYQRLKHIPVGIQPLRHQNGVFQKTMIEYTNTTGFANKGATHLITEQTLLKPFYRIFLLLDLKNEDEEKLYHNIKKQQAIFLPYMGKNDYSLWWDKDEVKEYDFEENFSDDNAKKVITVFSKSVSVQKSKVDDADSNSFDVFGGTEEVKESFVCFEKLPTHYSEELRQYHLEDFAYTNIELKPDVKIKNLFFLHEEKKYVQLN